MLIDTHCHIQFKAYNEDRDAVVARCKEKGMILNLVGTQMATSKLAVQMAEQYDWMYASVGLHPIQEYKVKVKEESTEFMSCGEEFDDAVYEELAQHPKVIAMGETGLDRFHVPKDRTTEEIMEKQKQTFLQHYLIAKKYDLPLVIHVRDAHNDMRAVLETLETPVRGTVHCFTGNWEQAQFYLSKGLNLGFTGVITFPAKKTDPKAQEQLNEVIEKIPLDKIVVETDSPYLAPQAFRGTRAEPWMTEEVVKHIANVRGLSFEEMSDQIEKNTRALFTKIK